MRFSGLVLCLWQCLKGSFVFWYSPRLTVLSVKTRYNFKYRAVDGLLVLKVTDDRTVCSECPGSSTSAVISWEVVDPTVWLVRFVRNDVGIAVSARNVVFVSDDIYTWWFTMHYMHCMQCCTGRRNSVWNSRQTRRRTYEKWKGLQCGLWI
jgi:hypothetical protein